MYTCYGEFARIPAYTSNKIITIRPASVGVSSIVKLFDNLYYAIFFFIIY